MLLAASSGRPERWVVFLGSPDVARAAWVVTPGAAVRAVVPVDKWPEGVKVLGATVRGNMVYVLVQTVETMDQPKDVKSVWTIDASYATAGTLDDDWRFVGADSVDDIQKRLSMPPPSAGLRHEDMINALKGAGASIAAVGKAFPEAGADYYYVWQEAITQKGPHLDYKTVARSPLRGKIMRLVNDAALQERCESQICWAYGELGELLGGVAMAQDGGSVVIQGFVEAMPSRTAKTGTPTQPSDAQNVATDGPNTRQALLEQMTEAPAQIYGEAPLGNGGTIGVAQSKDPDHHVIVVVREGNFTRIYHDTSAVRGGLVPQEVHFADVDGDGRNDVIVHSAGKWNAGIQTVNYYRALIAPHSLQTFTLEGDVAAEMAMAGADSMKTAVDAALKVTPKGVRLGDACRDLNGAWTLDGFRRAAVDDAKILTFDEPGWPLPHGTLKRGVVTLRPDDVKQVGRMCRKMTCDPSRPVCTYMEPGAYSEYYWFTFNGDFPRLAGAAFYNGQ